MAALDISLDDMIKNSKKNSKIGGRGQGKALRGRGSGGSSRGGRGGRPIGAPRRNVLGLNARSSSNTISKPFRRTKNLPWQNGLLEDGLRAAGFSGADNVTKLYVSNLDLGVTSEDVRELFSEVGELIRYVLHYDKNGRPNGSAEVIFARKSEAFQALKRYNNVQLDGKPMKIEIIGANAEVPLSTRLGVAGGVVNGKKRTAAIQSGPGRFGGGFAGANRGSGQRGRGGLNSGRGGSGRAQGRGGRAQGRGGARLRKKPTEKSVDELDKELESYHAEAMQS